MEGVGMANRILCTVLLLLGLMPFVFAQSDNSMEYAAAATSKFVNLPGLPECMTIAVQHGDPSKGASVLLIKFTPGCVVPWHWHTANEALLMVSGTGKAEMKDGKPLTVHPGDYVFLPGKSAHQFTAVTAVTVFDTPEGVFDIHYVDSLGKEIPPDQALKPASMKGAAGKLKPQQ
jgi:quercetin dioxygenase-like cupin family protein